MSLRKFLIDGFVKEPFNRLAFFGLGMVMGLMYGICIGWLFVNAFGQVKP